MLSAVFTGLLLQTPKTIFERAIAGHESLKNSRVLVAYTVERKGAPKQTVQFDVSYRRPNRLSVQEVGTKRLFVMTPEVGVIYDGATGQYVEKKNFKAKSLEGRVAEMRTGLDGTILALATPTGIRDRFRGLGTAAVWSSAKNSSGWIVSGKTLDDQLITLQFGEGYRLSGLSMSSTNEGGLSYSIRYAGDAGPISWRRPPGSFPVAKMDGRTAPPQYDGPATRAAFERAFAVFDHLKSLQMTVNQGGIDTSLAFNQGRYRQSGPTMAWAYDGKTLTVADHLQRRFLRVSVARADLFDTVSRAGGQADPVLLALARRVHPLRTMFDRTFRARTAGSIGLDGERCWILEARTERNTITLVVSQASGKVMRITSSVVAPDGSRVTASDRLFRAVGVNPSIPASAFRVAKPAGYRVVTLGQL